MMCTGLLEGAILEEPYASWAIWEGNKKLMQTQEKDFQFAVWIATDSLGKDKRKAEQTRKFIVAYKTAVENINKGLYADSLRSILLREYAMPQAIIDTLQLSGRGIKRQKFNPDTFINTTLFKQP